MLNVRLEKQIANEPDTATLWVDRYGVVAFLHRSGPQAHGMYQLTRLRDGSAIKSGQNKDELVSGFCLLPCEVSLSNSSNAS